MLKGKKLFLKAFQEDMQILRIILLATVLISWGTWFVVSLAVSFTLRITHYQNYVQKRTVLLCINQGHN